MNNTAVKTEVSLKRTVTRTITKDDLIGLLAEEHLTGEISFVVHDEEGTKTTLHLADIEKVDVLAEKAAFGSTFDEKLCPPSALLANALKILE